MIHNDETNYNLKLKRYESTVGELGVKTGFENYGLIFLRKLGYRPSPLIFWRFGQLALYYGIHFGIFQVAVLTLLLIINYEFNARVFFFILSFSFLCGVLVGMIKSQQAIRFRLKHGLTWE
jgi:hypothetical protein